VRRTVALDVWVKGSDMRDRRRDRTKAIAVLALALVGFPIALVVGYRYFETFEGVLVGLLILAVAAFVAYELWWKTSPEDN